MGIYTRYTRKWLERRYAGTGSIYRAHMPVYGIGDLNSEPGHALRIARTFQILRTLAGVSFDTLLDVGAGEGWLAAHAQRLLGVRAVVGDLACGSMRAAHALFELESLALDSSRLPFHDGAFDVVVCSEVLEHVEHPVETMLELLRVAKVAVALTTEELHWDKAKIDERLFERPGSPHMERNLVHEDDLRHLFGERAAMRTQFVGTPPADGSGADAIRRFVREGTRSTRLEREGCGVLLLAPRLEGLRASPPRVHDERILDALLTETLPAGPLPRRARGPLPAFVRERLRVAEPPVRDGVPDFFDEGAPDPTRAELEARLRACFPHDAARREAILLLRDRLFLPEDERKSEWDFTQRADRRGWKANEQLVPRAETGRGFAWHSTGPDPWLVSPWLATPITSLTLEMRVSNPAFGRDAGEAEVFWLTENELGVDRDRRVGFRVVNDGEMHEYRVDLAGPTRGERVLSLRLDLVNGPCEVDLAKVVVERG